MRNLCTLTSVLRVQGKYGEAEEKGRLLPERQEERLGKAHPDVLDSTVFPTKILIEQRKFEEADTMLEQVSRHYIHRVHPQIA